MIRLSTLLIVAAFITALCWAMDRTAWPSPRMDIQWHQTCLYAMSPETLEAIGRPAYPCDREFYDI